MGDLGAFSNAGVHPDFKVVAHKALSAGSSVRTLTMRSILDGMFASWTTDPIEIYNICR